MKAQTDKVQGQQVTKNIRLCPDGVYRWTYEYHMLRNPTILFTVWKVLGISFCAVFLFTLVIDLIQGVISSVSDLWNSSKVFIILAGIFFVISIISYLILAATYGWKYQVLFEMTGDSVKHIQMPKQVKQAEVLAFLTALAGAAAHRPGVTGAGLLASAKSTSVSEFRSVETVKVHRKRNTIHVNRLFDRNQVYAEDADFDFVERFITEHCTKAKIK